jgi:hypothetical protein
MCTQGPQALLGVVASKLRGKLPMIARALAWGYRIAVAIPYLLAGGMATAGASCPPVEDNRSFCLEDREGMIGLTEAVQTVARGCRLESLLSKFRDRHLAGW